MKYANVLYGLSDCVTRSVTRIRINLTLSQILMNHFVNPDLDPGSHLILHVFFFENQNKNLVKYVIIFFKLKNSFSAANFNTVNVFRLRLTTVVR